MKVKIHLGEFLNLIHNKPVFPGNTISHQAMKELADAGLATRDNNGDHIPTDRGLWVFNQLSCKTIEITETHSFNI